MEKSDHNKKVLVAMSGGVDSAVAALLLKEQGYDVIGANMRFWEYDASCDTGEKKRHTSCCSPEDLKDAERVARSIGIPFYAIKMEQDFKKKVIQPFIQAYTMAQTPNPCVLCNTEIKFGIFYEKAKSLGFDYVATGHYARRVKVHNRYAIAPAKDKAKDQSYYLYGLNQEALSQTLFPLADITKEDVRKIANKNQLPVAKKPESQEICFIPENNYRVFLQKQGVKFQPGFIRDIEGRILAKHDGKENFTIGQRRGLKIALGKKLYVIDILQNGDVIVGEKKDLDVRRFILKEPVFQALPPSKCKGEAFIQIRYNSPAVRCVYQYNGSEFHVKLLEFAGAVTSGQAGVIYNENGILLAGGTIQRI
ncbi:MAG: tRNA 2-thiouridine(34) synthase MnmA [Candidatus Hydrogenedentota bacterium]|nr:MAG: tRNA 2-thiouridine(34) synthase MnmA [Candidatus Hydrogenedentota bacterium]